MHNDAKSEKAEDSNPRSILKVAAKTAAVVLTSMGLIAGVYAFLIGWIDSRIETKTSDSEFLKKVAARVRPSIIFNGGGSVLADMGGLEYIEPRIDVTTTNDYEVTITIHPRRHLANAPLLTCLDKPITVANGTRGEGLTWVFAFKVGFFIANQTGELGGSPKPHDRYRLEIMP